MAAKSSTEYLPDEILQLILYYVSPDDTLLNFQRVSRRFARVSCEPLLWRYHCLHGFKYWDSKHSIQQKLSASATNVDWKKLYLYRRHVDTQTTSALDGILAGQIRRIEKYESISQFGYDAKDSLLRHCRTRDDADDVLARRFD
jgi:F-box protein 21